MGVRCKREGFLIFIVISSNEDTFSRKEVWKHQRVFRVPCTRTDGSFCVPRSRRSHYRSVQRDSVNVRSGICNSAKALRGGEKSKLQVV